MAEIPSANTSIADQGGGFAGGTGYAVVMGCVPTNADTTPRVFSSGKALLDEHDYSQAADYVALHIAETRKPVIFVGLPIVTAGTLGSQDTTGVTGTSLITVAAGTLGVLDEIDGIVTIDTGGTVGTNGITGTISCDGGNTSKPFRLGTGTTYTIPYVGVVITFGAGTLVADDVFTFRTVAPKWDSAGMAAAFTALASQQKRARSVLVVGSVADATEAGYVVTGINGYETTAQRFAYARAQVKDRSPQASLAKIKKHMVGAPQLTFAEVGATGDTVTRDTGSWITDGFAVGDVVTFAGTASNNVTGAIASLSATILTFGTTDLAAEVITNGVTVVGSQGLTFAEVGATGDTITRISGSWLDDGFKVGDTVTITGSALNNVSGPIATLTATVLTFGTTDLAVEVIGAHSVSITASQTMSAWVSAADATFATIADEKRIDLGLGKATKLSPITGWLFRRPVQWAASIREYQHDIHIPTWAKELGPVSGWSLVDSHNNIVEYDELTVGGALAGRFTCFRTWANGPDGTFIALSLTRANEGSLLSRTHNMAVANVMCTVVQAETEYAIGKSLVLNPDGTGEEASLSKLEQRVNSRLKQALLTNGTEGQRASGAKWAASRTDVLNVPSPTMTGTGFLEENGTIEHINTTVVIQTAGG